MAEFVACVGQLKALLEQVDELVPSLGEDELEAMLAVMDGGLADLIRSRIEA